MKKIKIVKTIRMMLCVVLCVCGLGLSACDGSIGGGGSGMSGSGS